MQPARPLAARSLAPFAPFAIALAVGVPACRADTADPAAGPPAGSGGSGAYVYGRYCALCHGAHGEGYVADDAPALANPELLASASDAFLARATKDGRPGTTMSAWSTDHLGPLPPADVDAVVAYMRAWQSTPSQDVTSLVVKGDAARAAPLYAEKCAQCHGATGKEGPNIRVANPVFLDSASDGYLRWAIARGRPGTQMAAYAGALTAAQLDDLVALLRSWQTPVPPGDVPFPGSVAPVLLNPGGPEPAFPLGERYTPADLVVSELGRGATMAFIDARPPADYATVHVRGATNIPFYEIAGYRTGLPKDHWIIAYCGCPHAESGTVASDLLANGFTKVSVLDEGFGVWQQRGYPVTKGPLP